MKMDELMKQVQKIFSEYVVELSADFYMKIRSDSWTKWLDDPVVYRVVGAMLARQVYFTIQFVSSPRLWNKHTGPLILRPMMETYLKLAWIAQDPVVRCTGIARADLLGGISRLSQLKEKIASLDLDEGLDQSDAFIKMHNDELLNFQGEHKPIMIESREMAQKLGGRALDAYRKFQIPFSSSVHSTWNHISRCNLIHDPNPLHRYQLVAMFPEIRINLVHALSAAEICDETFGLFQNGSEDSKSPLEMLYARLEELSAGEEDDLNRA